ncbi:hypothetical protein ACQEVB_10235 [Pseudonocardia sp. CA-107938]|uniref:hypothetical protein n=1 Tax=Pseudonocardia sp. CA-107938 TaxID=3240021 RepID=UPI003D8E930A
MAGREWDTRVVWNDRRGCWWWNAWRETTCTEVWGFADSPEEALRAMTVAIRRAGDGVTPSGGPTR